MNDIKGTLQENAEQLVVLGVYHNVRTGEKMLSDKKNCMALASHVELQFIFRETLDNVAYPIPVPWKETLTE